MNEEMIIQIQELLTQYGLQKIEEMQNITPVRTGLLKNSFRQSLQLTNLTINNDAYYAGFVDRGTRYMEARNFTAPFYDGLSDLETRIASAIEDFIAISVKGNIEEGIKTTI